MSVTGNMTPRHGDPYNYPIIPDVPIIANPAPLGLAAFGITTFVLSVYNAGWGGSKNPNNVIVGLALFYGGLAQLLAGMWEFKAGNTFGATAFSSYGAFWLSFATILIPGSGVIDAFKTIPDPNHPGDATYNLVDGPELDTTIGIYLLGWCFLTFIFFLCTLRQNIASILLFGMLTITFLLLAIGKLSHPNAKTGQQAGGYTGIFTAVIALYIVLANLANKEHTFFTLPIGRIAPIENDVLKKKKSEMEV
ncbi:unnamed protein product [Calypogeia fissa]